MNRLTSFLRELNWYAIIAVAFVALATTAAIIGWLAGLPFLALVIALAAAALVFALLDLRS